MATFSPLSLKKLLTASNATLTAIAASLVTIAAIVTLIKIDTAPPVPITGTVAVSGITGAIVVTSGDIAISNFPIVQTVDGTVDVGNFPAFPTPYPTQAVSGTFWPVTQPVSGTFWQATQPVSGTVAVSNFPASSAVTGTFWQATQPVSGAFFQATQPVSGTVTANAGAGFPTPYPTQAVSGTFWQATQPVSGTFFQATQPVSGTVTATGTFWQATQPVSGTFWQATQPVSGTVGVSNSFALDATLTGGTQKAIARGAAKGATIAADATATANGADHTGLDVAIQGTVPVSGTFWQATQPVSGTFWQATQPVSGTVAVSNFPASQAVTGTFWQATQPVSGTFWQATQPVSGTVAVSNSFALDATLTGGTQKAIARGAAKGATIAADATATANGADHTGLDVAIQGTVPVSGTFWQATQPVSGTFWQATQPVSGTVTATGTFWQATQPVSGTFWQATQPVSGTVTITPPTLTKGTQGATGLSTQDLKDAGRTFVTFTADAIAGVTGDATISFSKNVGGTITAAQTSYVITSGKTLRIQSISYSVKSAAAAIAFSKIRLRLNTGGACVVGSGLVSVLPEINTNSATSGTSAWLDKTFPDGFDIAGDGTKAVCLSHLDQATTNVLNVTLQGYEY